MLTLSVETATDWTCTYCSCFWQPSCPESEANQHCVGTITFFFVLEIHIVTPKLPLWLKQGPNYWSAFMPRFCKVATSYPSPLRELTNHLPGCGDENFDLTNLWIEWRLTATWGDGSPLCLFLSGRGSVLLILSPCLISPGQFPAVINLAPSTWKSKPFQKWNTIREGGKV